MWRNNTYLQLFLAVLKYWALQFTSSFYCFGRKGFRGTLSQALHKTRSGHPKPWETPEIFLGPWEG